VIATGPEPLAEVEFGAKILDDKGDIVDTQVFRATAPVAGTDAAAAAAACDNAFSKVATDMVVWTLGAIE
jgi:ABC-type uncharacterized transport system auxiliary subunit